jgi:phenylacetate-coenzyme A ligase PaaK-like adenylate-forming protein
MDTPPVFFDENEALDPGALAALQSERLRALVARLADVPFYKRAFADAGLAPGDMRRAIESSLGIEAFNNYGLSEVIGPGVSGECTAHAGMHVQGDHFLVVEPQTLKRSAGKARRVLDHRNRVD